MLCVSGEGRRLRMGRKGAAATRAAPRMWVKLCSFPSLPPYLSRWDFAVTASHRTAGSLFLKSQYYKVGEKGGGKEAYK